MTNEEALKGFSDYCKECRTNAQTLGADVVCGVCKVFVAKQAIGMQIPKNPIVKQTKRNLEKTVLTQYNCPSCNRVFYNLELCRNSIDVFCDRCGQAIDWSDEYGL